MGFKITSREIIAIVICIVIVGAIYVGFNQFFNNNKNTLKIVSMELNKSEEGLNFTVTVKIQNTGSNDINNAELNLIFIKDNDIVDSKKQSLYLQSNLQNAYSANFINVPFGNESTYKAIATISLGNEILDTQTITKQF
jgi:archaellum component FlaF (FlaF/FlaG flagellin family)